jgi:hypothetical protein
MKGRLVYEMSFDRLSQKGEGLVALLAAGFHDR